MLSLFWSEPSFLPLDSLLLLSPRLREYTSYFPKGPDTRIILSKEADREFESTLIPRDGSWKILKNDYLEIWERPDPWSNWHPAPDVSKINSVLSQTGSG